MIRLLIAALLAIPATAHADDDEAATKVPSPEQLHQDRRRVLDDADQAIDEASRYIKDLRRRRDASVDEPTDPDEQE